MESHATTCNLRCELQLLFDIINMETTTDDEHRHYMRIALAEARKSPPKPTNFCVGACLVTPSQTNKPSSKAPLITGYTLECAGNTHAEQCCFIKLSSHYNCTEDTLGEHLPDGTALYTTMEPCNKRSVGNMSCVERILGLKKQHGTQAIAKVYVGAAEPETFVGVNEGRRRLEEAGVRVVHVPGMEEEILAVATTGHEKGGNALNC